MGKGNLIGLTFALFFSGAAPSHATLTETFPGGRTTVKAPARIAVADGQNVSFTASGPVTVRVAGKAFKVKRRGRSAIRVVLARRGDRLTAATADDVLLDVRTRQLVEVVARGRLIEPLTGTSAVEDLLAQRAAAIFGRLAQRHHYLGSGVNGRIRVEDGWASGFLPGALWRSAEIHNSRTLARWAAQATDRVLGRETEDMHDRGFIYSNSAWRAWQLSCVAQAKFPVAPGRCQRWRRSLRLAAAHLTAMMGATPVKVLPTRLRDQCTGCEAHELDVIVDSLLNMDVLRQAVAFGGPVDGPQLATGHARWVRQHHVREDGSTWQSVQFDRTSGGVTRKETHQGLRDESAWARGQSWAVLGLARQFNASGEVDLLDGAHRAADFALGRLAARGETVPPYDYDAPSGAPTDTSAGATLAVGLRELAAGCRTSLMCDADRYAQASVTLTSALSRYVRPVGLVGFFDGQAYTIGGRSRWDDRSELAWGLMYLLDAVGSTS